MLKLLKHYDFKTFFGSILNVIVYILIAIFPVSLFYSLFFANSDFIWSQNIKIDSMQLAPSIRPWQIERDGCEVYVLFGLVLISIITSFLLVFLYRKVLNLKASYLRYVIGLVFISILLFGSLNFLDRVGFYPPMSQGILWLQASPFAVVASLLMIMILAFKDRYLSLFGLLICLLLIPAVFISTASPSWVDYEYIFAPALRLLHHSNLSEVYFQYDFFLSLIALIFMKLKISLSIFPLIGQLSFYLFFIFAFVFSRKFFHNPKLAYFFLITLVIIKIYAFKDDLVTCFQVTPLRLDLWLIVLWLAFSKGLSSRWLGVALALLVFFHHTFGVIYVASYFLAVAFVSAQDFIDIKDFLPVLKKLIKKYFFNICLLFAGFLLYTLVFQVGSQGAGSLYQQIGIGFLPISKISFYWWIAALLSLGTVLVFRLKQILSDRYFQASVFLIMLALGNSIYFFGRSHENNILNISASLIFVFYLVCDLCFIRLSGRNWQRGLWAHLTNYIPVTLIIMAVLFYAPGIEKKATLQLGSLERIATQSFPSVPLCGLETVKAATRASTKVYFMSQYDFYCNYQGGYTPQGYFSPYLTWAYEKDLTDFLQSLLNNGYYLVLPQGETGRDMEIINKLHYDNKTEDKNILIISQQKD